MPIDSADHANNVHRRVDVNQASSSLFVMRAATANANGIENPTNPVYSRGGWISIPGDCSSGLSPLPSAGTGDNRVNGSAGINRSMRKNNVTPDRTAPAAAMSLGDMPLFVAE